MGRPKGSKNKEKSPEEIEAKKRERAIRKERCHVHTREELARKRREKLSEKEYRRIENMVQSFMKEPNITYKNDEK